ncbi:hypothetical protein BKA63DRAFT_496330 [Paraphoma chrysanthemicola]|nr:hypothetical protein BKA63DRAFT_496330 [Paraphoma chrysanthemicola]
MSMLQDWLGLRLRRQHCTQSFTNPEFTPWLKPNQRLKDQSAYPRFVVERALETPTRHGHWDTRGEISELEGQVTYWYRTLSSGGWDGERIASARGNPLAVTPFVRGFVISKWTAHLNHIRRSYAHIRAALFSDTSQYHHDNLGGAIHHTALWSADWKEWMFETMTRLTTDLYLYRLDAKTNMRALGIDPDASASYSFVGKRETQMWRLLCATCIDLQDMFQQLANSYTQVVALREAPQASNAQVRSVRWLTVLGTFVVVERCGRDHVHGRRLSTEWEEVLGVFCGCGPLFDGDQWVPGHDSGMAESEDMAEE